MGEIRKEEEGGGGGGVSVLMVGVSILSGRCLLDQTHRSLITPPPSPPSPPPPSSSP